MPGSLSRVFCLHSPGTTLAFPLVMEWPTKAVERVRPSRFAPSFCPWPECSTHRGASARFHRHGSYRRPSDDRRIPRFRCLACRRTCSRQTFSFTYYLKRRDLPAEIAAGLVAGSAQRQLSRSRFCSKTTVTRLADRLSRHAVLLQGRALAALNAIHEPVVDDHFETFIQRQDQALGIAMPSGAKSWFIFGADPARHRGSGRRADRKGTPEASPEGDGAYAASIGRTLDFLARCVPPGQRLRLIVDGRRDYRTALERHLHRDRFELIVYPNPKRGPKGAPRSSEAIERDHAMFPVDHFHQLVRHTCKDQARETISFGRRMEPIVGRQFLTIVWRNFVKGRSERKPDRRTPAMLLGLSDQPWPWARVLTQRLFPARESLPPPWEMLYRGLWRAPVRQDGPRHAY